jgi:hypothetical protein
MVRVDATGADDFEEEEDDYKNYAKDFLSPNNLEQQNRNSQRASSTMAGDKKDYKFSNRNNT